MGHRRCQPMSMQERVCEHVHVRAAVREQLAAAGHWHALVDAAHARALGADVYHACRAGADAESSARGLLVHERRLEAEACRAQQQREHFRAEATVEQVRQREDDARRPELGLAQTEPRLPASTADGAPPDLLQRGE